MCAYSFVFAQLMFSITICISTSRSWSRAACRGTYISAKRSILIACEVHHLHDVRGVCLRDSDGATDMATLPGPSRPDGYRGRDCTRIYVCAMRVVDFGASYSSFCFGTFVFASVGCRMHSLRRDPLRSAPEPSCDQVQHHRDYGAR